jgi:hypothetical protein
MRRCQRLPVKRIPLMRPDPDVCQESKTHAVRIGAKTLIWQEKRHHL